MAFVQDLVLTVATWVAGYYTAELLQRQTTETDRRYFMSLLEIELTHIEEGTTPAEEGEWQDAFAPYPTDYLDWLLTNGKFDLKKDIALIRLLHEVRGRAKQYNNHAELFNQLSSQYPRGVVVAAPPTLASLLSQTASNQRDTLAKSSELRQLVSSLLHEPAKRKWFSRRRSSQIPPVTKSQ